VNDLAQLFFAVAILINAILSVLTFRRSMSSAKALDLLEKNTNSIKDALVKVTGESEHAKGMLAGQAQEKLKEGKTS
jgi:hypothetical protein